MKAVHLVGLLEAHCIWVVKKGIEKALVRWLDGLRGHGVGSGCYLFCEQPFQIY